MINLCYNKTERSDICMGQWINMFMYTDRKAFLRSNLLQYLPCYEVDKLIEKGVSCADQELIEYIAKRRVHKYCVQTGSFSFVLGSVGPWLWLVDYIQFYFHSALLAQELYYLYDPIPFFKLSSKKDIQMLFALLLGATSSVKTVGTFLSGATKFLLRKTGSTITVSMIPAASGIVNGCMSYVLLQSLAEEFIKQMKNMKKPEHTASYEVKEVIELPYQEHQKQEAFCNLEKLHELYIYVQDGYITKEEFEGLKQQYI